MRAPYGLPKTGGGVAQTDLCAEQRPGPQSDPSSLLPRVRAGEVGAGSSPQLAPSPSVDNHTGAAE